MSDLISRQAAIDAFLTELTKRERKNLLHTWSTVEVKYFVVDMLEKLPSAKHEQKPGRWNFIGDNMFECTNCKVVYTTNQLNSLRNYDTDPYAPRFCPNCGADMRGEQDG